MKRFILERLRLRLPGQRWRYALLLVVLAGVLVFSLSQLIAYYTRSAREEQALRALSQIAAGDVSPDADATSATPASTGSAQAKPAQGQQPDRLAQYRKLQQRNPDMVGWVRIDGTTIDYPVMYTPSDGDFYLNHGFDKAKSASGVPFIDGRCTADPLADNTIVYGHHMKNGTMFAGLESYRDAAFYADHRQIAFDTMTAQGQYDVLAVFEGKIYTAEEKAFRYYNFIHASGPKEFDQFVSKVQALSLYDTGVRAAYGDKLLTLITCDYHRADGQFVVIARTAGAKDNDK